MKIVIAIDSFKGSLSSRMSGLAAADGIKKVFPHAEIVIRPVADGGEGTVEALTEGLSGKMQTVSVTNPVGEKLYKDFKIRNSAYPVLVGNAGFSIYKLTIPANYVIISVLVTPCA